MIYPHARLIVFARAPRAGEAKTRLIPRFGAEGAAALHARLIEHCLGTVTGAGLCPVQLWCAPGADDPFFRACGERYGVDLHDQGSGDLGGRMYAALASALNHAGPALLVGTDIPGLEAGDLDAALQWLHDDVDVVLGPARDGGYYLIGTKQAHPDVFRGMNWGSSTVYEDTVDRLERRGWRWRRLREQRDVDAPEDYDKLPDALKRALGPPAIDRIPVWRGAEK